jgi:hypothetical protein
MDFNSGQDLLAEPKVERRLNTLRKILRQILDTNEGTSAFPPHFSAN